MRTRPSIGILLLAIFTYSPSSLAADKRLGVDSIGARNINAGQMNFYLNYMKENEMEKGDNPPVGIVLCTHNDKAEVKFDKLVNMLRVKYGYTPQKGKDEIGKLWAEYQAKKPGNTSNHKE